MESGRSLSCCVSPLRKSHRWLSSLAGLCSEDSEGYKARQARTKHFENLVSHLGMGQRIFSDDYLGTTCCNCTQGPRRSFHRTWRLYTGALAGSIATHGPPCPRSYGPCTDPQVLTRFHSHNTTNSPTSTDLYDATTWTWNSAQIILQQHNFGATRSHHRFRRYNGRRQGYESRRLDR